MKLLYKLTTRHSLNLLDMYICSGMRSLDVYAIIYTSMPSRFVPWVKHVMRTRTLRVADEHTSRGRRKYTSVPS